ncbi:MAG: hypothetical protein ABR591_13360 [Candidatus Velthaea sp.]
MSSGIPPAVSSISSLIVDASIWRWTSYKPYADPERRREAQAQSQRRGKLKRAAVLDAVAMISAMMVGFVRAAFREKFADAHD